MFALYTTLKFVHVLAAIVWVGGVIAVAVLNGRLISTNDRSSILAISRTSSFFGQAVVSVAALLTLLVGAATAGIGRIGFGSLWIIWGFAAIVLSIALGASLIRITTARLGLAATGDEVSAEQLAGLQRRLALLNTINILLLISAVWAMVAKPVF